MRIAEISVTGLFGIFDYKIPLKLQDRITIIHGPNGFGKTAVLRLLYGLFNGKYTSLRRIPFKEFRVRLDQGTELWATKPAPATGRADARRREVGVELHCVKNGEEQDRYQIGDTQRSEHLDYPLSLVSEVVPDLERIGSTTWRLRSTGEHLDLEEVLERYADDIPLPAHMRTRTGKEKPDWLQEITSETKVRFIETQRLLSLTVSPRSRTYETRSVTVPAVKEYSDELSAAIRSKLAESAAMSQSLDRTFPARVVQQDGIRHLGVDQIRGKLSELENRRSHLMEVGLVDAEKGLDFQEVGQIAEPMQSVLSVYVQDMEQKLSVFDEMAAKIDLLKRIINQRFLYKELAISKDKGFVFLTSGGVELAPEDLSSGEQHELVLLYELLFKVAEGSCILIDEPELSLHVVWQEAFLQDLQDIANLRGLDVVLATHSPQIIHDRWDLTVELRGPTR